MLFLSFLPRKIVRKNPKVIYWLLERRLELTLLVWPFQEQNTSIPCWGFLVLIKVGGGGCTHQSLRGTGSHAGVSGSWPSLPYLMCFNSLTKQMRKPKSNKVTDLPQVVQVVSGRMRSRTTSPDCWFRLIFLLLDLQLESSVLSCLLSDTSIITLKQWTIRWHLWSVRSSPRSFMYIKHWFLWQSCEESILLLSPFNLQGNWGIKRLSHLSKDIS